MCLGEVGVVRDAAAPDALSVDVGGRTVTVSGMLLDEPPAVGDWLVVHSGFALGKLTDAEARDALDIRRAAGRDAG